MVSFARVFKRYFLESVKIVESQLEVKLDDIGYYPLWQFALREFQPCSDLDEEYNSKSLEEDILEYRESWLLEKTLIGKAGNKGIYYTRPLFTKNLSSLDARQTLFHELYHIGLSKFAGDEDIFSEERELKLSEILNEAFADMMAIRTLQQNYGLNVRGCYINEMAWLEYELEINSISSNPKDIANFVLSYDPWTAVNNFEKWVLKKIKIKK